MSDIDDANARRRERLQEICSRMCELSSLRHEAWQLEKQLRSERYVVKTKLGFVSDTSHGKSFVYRIASYWGPDVGRYDSREDAQRVADDVDGIVMPYAEAEERD